MYAVFATIDLILGIFTWLIIASAIFSWLYAFNIINANNQFIAMVGNFLYQITEPVFRPVRRIIPSFNGIDISPIVVLVAIFFLRELLRSSIAPIFLHG